MAIGRGAWGWGEMERGGRGERGGGREVEGERECPIPLLQGAQLDAACCRSRIAA